MRHSVDTPASKLYVRRLRLGFLAALLSLFVGLLLPSARASASVCTYAWSIPNQYVAPGNSIQSWTGSAASGVIGGAYQQKDGLWPYFVTTLTFQQSTNQWQYIYTRNDSTSGITSDGWHIVTRAYTTC